jgi:hypothetical protein
LATDEKELVEMINTLKKVLFLVAITMILSGCFPAFSSNTQAVLTSVSPSSTSEKPPSVAFTATGLPNITPPPTQYFPPLLTPRVTPFPTRLPADVREDLSYMLQTNGNCVFPCFWGIRPDITRYEELYSVIDKLGGLRFEALQTNGRVRVASHFKFEEDNGIFVEFAVDLQDDIVRDLKVLLLNLYDVEVTPEDWSAYNMDEILRTYGVPDKVELYYSGHYNSISIDVQLKYESIDTSIVYYAGTTKTTQYETPTSVIFCPEEIGVNIVELHMGKNPFNTIPDGVPIFRATDLNEQDFHKLFTENPSACLTLNRKAFYP